jgi:hypothetical protein
VERAGKVLGAFKCKSTPNVSAADLTGLKAFSEMHANVPLHVVAPVKASRKIGDVTVLPPLQALTTIDARL